MPHQMIISLLYSDLPENCVSKLLAVLSRQCLITGANATTLRLLLEWGKDQDRRMIHHIL